MEYNPKVQYLLAARLCPPEVTAAMAQEPEAAVSLSHHFQMKLMDRPVAGDMAVAEGAAPEPALMILVTP